LGGWSRRDFREHAGPSTSSEGGFPSSAQHNAREPFPPRWLELLAKLNTEVGPWVMPKDGTVARTSGPPIEHDDLGLALLPADELPQRWWKRLLDRLLWVIRMETRSDEPLHQSWPANDNAPTTLPPGNALNAH
jgi:hypothetical protein